MGPNSQAEGRASRAQWPLQIMMIDRDSNSLERDEEKRAPLFLIPLQIRAGKPNA